MRNELSWEHTMRRGEGGLWGAWRALGAAMLFGCAAASSAAELSFGGSLAATSDYIFQGVSRSYGAEALQGSLEGRYRDWSAGIWASTLGDDPSANLELNLFLSRVWQISPDWSTNLTYTHYWYPDDRRRRSYEYDELSAALGFRNSVYASVSWTPNVSVTAYGGTAWDRASWSYEVTYAQPLSRAWTANLGVGHRDLESAYAESYWFGHAGIQYSLNSMSLHLTHTRADEVAERMFGPELVNGWSITAMWRFGAGN